jgi:hypothetical protein
MDRLREIPRCSSNAFDDYFPKNRCTETTEITTSYTLMWT